MPTFTLVNEAGVLKWKAPGRDPIVVGTPSRDTLIYGTYDPITSDVVGLIDPTATFTQVGSYSVDTAWSASSNNQIIENYEFWGLVNLLAYSNIIFKNCKFHGTLQRGGDTAVVVATGSNGRNVTFIDSLFAQRDGTIIDPRSRDHNEWCSLIRLSNYNMLRCEIIGFPDGFEFVVLPGNQKIKGCWSHDGHYMEWDISEGTDQSGVRQYTGGPTFSNTKPKGYYPYSTGTQHYTHADGLQWAIGGGQEIIGNHIGGTRVPGTHNHVPSQMDLIRSGHDYYNSAIILKQEVNSSDANHIKNVSILHNWFEGGAATLNIVYNFGNAFRDNVEIAYNRFIRSTWGSQLYLIQWHDTGGVGVANIHDNVFDDDDSPVPITKGN
jgi:hypothetical protein